MTARRRGLLAVLATAAAPGARAQSGTWVVTDREAALPVSRENAGSRSVTRGPAIRQVSPSANVAPGRPFWLRVEFAGRGGEQVNAASVQVVLLRGGNIDITQRLRGFVSASGIDIPDALVPAGTHVLRVEVSDARGRQSTTVVEIDAR